MDTMKLLSLEHMHKENPLRKMLSCEKCATLCEEAGATFYRLCSDCLPTFEVIWFVKEHELSRARLPCMLTQHARSANMTIDYLIMGLKVEFPNAIYLASESPDSLECAMSRLCTSLNTQTNPPRVLTDGVPFSIAFDLSAYCLTQTPRLNNRALWELLTALDVPLALKLAMGATDYLASVSTYRPSTGSVPWPEKEYMNIEGTSIDDSR